MTVMAGVWVPEHSQIALKYLGGNSFIITPPFSPSAIWVTAEARPAAQLLAGQALGLVIRLHLGDQFGVAPLGLDHRGDAGLLAPGVLCRPASGQVRPLQPPPSGSSTVCSSTRTHSVAASVRVMTNSKATSGWLGRAISEGEKPRTRPEPPGRTGRRNGAATPARAAEVLGRGKRRHRVAPRAAQPLHRLQAGEPVEMPARASIASSAPICRRPCSSMPE